MAMALKDMLAKDKNQTHTYSHTYTHTPTHTQTHLHTQWAENTYRWQSRTCGIRRHASDYHNTPAQSRWSEDQQASCNNRQKPIKYVVVRPFLHNFLLFHTGLLLIIFINH